MRKLRRILAMVLVIAMTFTMLPVFAAADEAVVEAPAVETVEVPSAEPVAVEDVAVIPDAPAAEAPAVEAIATAPVEAVAALQDVSADDVAVVIDYNVGTEIGYKTLKAAYEAAGQVEGICEVVLLKDITHVLTSGTSATAGFLNGNAKNKANYRSWNMVNNMDWEAEVNGFWLDLNGHTITVRCVNTTDNNTGYYNPAFFLGDSIPLNIKNGTIIYKYSRTTQASGFALIACGYGGTSSSTHAIGTAEDLFTPNITLKDVNFFRVHNTGDLSTKAYKNGGPVITMAMLASNINLIRSNILSTSSAAIRYSRNTLRAVAPEGITSTDHNLTIEDSRVGSLDAVGAIYADNIDASETGLALESMNLNITLKGAAQFLGSAPIAQAEDGTPTTVNFAAADQLTSATTVVTAPDVNSVVAIAETSEVVPAYLAPAPYASFAYVDDMHLHTPVQREAIEATDTTLGFVEHYVCESCNTYFEADGATETTLAAVAICSHAAKAHVDAVPATFTAEGFAEHYKCATCGAYWEADGETVTTRDALVIPVLVCDHAAKAFVEKVEATAAETGMEAHYYCATCATYWAADGVTETTADALVIAKLGCSHPSAKYHEPVPATFSKGGVAAHWTCADCGKMYADENMTVETTEAELETPKRATTDIADLTDAELFEMGAVAKTVTETGANVAAYMTLQSAYAGAGASETIANVVLLRDVFIIGTSDSYVKGAISGSVNNKETYLTWDTVNTSDSELTVKGFWLDLNGHTVMVRCKNSANNNDGTMQPAIYTPGYLPVNIKNGTIVYRYSATKQTTNKSLISTSYGSSTSNKGTLATADVVYTPAIAIKDANLIRVHDSGDFSYNYAENKITKYSNAGPVITVKNLASDIKIIRSNVLSSAAADGAIDYAKNIYWNGTVPAGLALVEHNLYIENSRVGVPGGAKAIGGETIVGTNAISMPCTLNVTAKGAVQFIGTDAVAMDENGPAVVFAAVKDLTETNAMVTLPEVSSLVSYTGNTIDVIPTYRAPAVYASNAYIDASHEHVKEYRYAVEAVGDALGVAEHWVCESCNTYWKADGTTETVPSELMVCGHAEKVHVDEVAATYTEEGMKEHYICSNCGAYWEADGVTETTREALVIPTNACAHAAKTFVDKVEPTYTETGMSAHHYCSDCETYWDAEGVNETTQDALVIPVMGGCPHADAVHHDPVPATFKQGGMIEYWTCGDCDKYFSDAELKVQVTEAELATPVRALDDIEGLTDEQLAAYGAVAKTVDPDGNTVVYMDLTSAYKEGYKWTKAGGVVTLLCDYTHYDTKDKAASGFFNGGVKAADAANASTYNIADADKYPTELNIKGFWLDLGGHTLVVRSGYGLFYTSYAVPFNVRNGRMIHQFTSSQTSAYTTFKHGTTSGCSVVGGPEYTFHNVDVIRLATAYKGTTGDGPMFYMNVLQSKINLIDSKLITETSTSVVQYLSGSSVPTTAPYHHELNIYGKSVIGSVSTGASAAAISSTDSVNGNGLEGDGIYVNVAEGATPIFLGVNMFNLKGTIAFGGNATTGYFSPNLKYGIAMPDKESLATATTAGVGATDSTEVTEAQQWVNAAQFDCEHATKAHIEEVPATYTEEGMKEHYYCDVCGNYWEADGVTETTREALILPVAACPHAAKAFVEEVPATVTATGMAAHYFCSDCGTYWMADGVTETTEDALVIPVGICTHSGAVHNEGTPATFLEGGIAEHWTCGACGKMFADSALTEETTEANLATAKRELTDTEGLVTDEDFAKLGAVAISIDPDGKTIAYLGSSAIADAYKYGATNWTEAGGVVRLVCDYTYVNAKDSSYTAPFVNYGANSMSTDGSYKYANAEANDARYAGLGLKGFWLDLGGHTLTMRTGKSVFYTRFGNSINIRNGRLVYQDTAKATSSYAMLKLGHTVDGGPGYDVNGVYCPEVTFDNLTVIRVPNDKDATLGGSGAAAGPLFWISMIQSKINLIDSTLINDDSSYIINYAKSLDASKNGGDVAATMPYRHEINLRGDVILGRSSAGTLIYTKSSGNSTETAPIAGEGIHVNVDENANVKFLGTSVASITDTALASASTLPQGYFTSSVKYTYTLPDLGSFATETTAGAGVQDMATPTEFSQQLKAVDSGTYAVFTPNGGEAGEPTSLAGAFRAWIANGYSGEIKLIAVPTADDISIATSLIGSTGTSYSTDSEGLSFPALYIVPAEASNGDLTFDLGGFAMNVKSGFIGMDEALKNFDLTIENGTVTNDAARSLIVLKGIGGTFKLDNANLACTLEDAYTNTILEARAGNAISILNNSNITSAFRAPLQIYTTSDTGAEDGRLLYYINDCELATLGGSKQYTINALSSNGTAHRPVTVIIDGNTTLRNDQENHFVSLHDDAAHWLTATTVGTDENGLFTVTGDAAASKLTTAADAAATVAFGEMSFAFAKVEDAIEFAELFGRNDAYATTLTLNKDSEVAQSTAIGQAGRKSAFTMDLNGKNLTGEALILANGGKGTLVDMTVVGEFGNAATEAKFFAHVPAVAYTSGNHYIIDKARFFTNYSLNLAENVSINLYTDGWYGDPDSVSYVLNGTEYNIEAPGAQHDWIVDTLTAKQMSDKIDAYAVKADGNTTYIDIVKGVSVQGYAESDPASAETDANVIYTLNATLKTMLIYGKMAEKYFNSDFSELTVEELASIGLETVPETDKSNLVHADRVVSGMSDATVDTAATSGFKGTSAVLEDTISLKFYFFGSEFEGATASIAGAAAKVVAQDGDAYVMAPVSAKDFDSQITVTMTAADGETVLGTVTDSVEAYTARVSTEDNAYKLAQALRAYGADAKRFSAAKAEA